MSEKAHKSGTTEGSFEQPEIMMEREHKVGDCEQDGYAGETVPAALRTQILETINAPAVVRVDPNSFMEQGKTELNDFWEDRRATGISAVRTNVLEGYRILGIGEIQGVGADSSQENIVRPTKGFRQSGCVSNLLLPVPLRFLSTSTRHSTMVLQVVLLVFMSASCASASSLTWEDFADNFGGDLAPLLALFGEQVTKQYLSESYGFLDNFIFALAPLGIITAIVAAIRVGGNTNLRSLVGRAKESRGTVEADLMSSTSEDVCELWNGQGVVRVLGSPVLLQLIHIESEKSGPKAGIYTLSEAIRNGHYRADDVEPDSETEAFLARQSPPNLSLNLSINTKRRRLIAEVITPVGILLQGGVLVFAALAQYRLRILKGNVPTVYGFPMFFAGTLGLATGMFLCARIIKSSTQESIHEPHESLIEDLNRNSNIWLQQGGQIVGDQHFESFAIRFPARTIITSKKSEKDRKTFVMSAVSTALFGFIAQFVSLRTMHPMVTIAQLGAILAMTVLRSFAHMHCGDKNDLENHKQVDGHELDWLAKELNQCESWEVVTGFDQSLPPKEAPNLAMDVMRSRARLVTLSEDWRLENRSRVKVLQNAIEGTMNYVFANMMIKDSSKEANDFRWSLPVKIRAEDNESASLVTLNLKREQDDSGNWKIWKADASELEAVLCLWSSSLTEIRRRRLEDGKPAVKSIRLLGPATDESKTDYKLWINRGTAYNEVQRPPAISASGLDEVQYFGWMGTTEEKSGEGSPTTTGFICVECNDSVEKLCTQDLYGWFVSGLVNIIQEIGGRTTRRPSDLDSERSSIATTTSGAQRGGRDMFRLFNSDLNLMATCFSESGLGTVEEAYFYLVPALRAAGNLPFPQVAHSGAISEVKKLEEEKNQWKRALEIDWWLYNNSRKIKTKSSRLNILFTTIELGGRLRRLSESLFVHGTKEYLDNDLSRVWDEVYSGWQVISGVSEDRAVSLFNLFVACPKAKPDMDPAQIFLLAFEAMQKLDVRVLRVADTLLDLARLAFENRFLDAAETLTKFVWTKTVLPWHGRQKTRNKEAGELFMNICQRKGTSLLNNEDIFLMFLSDPESLKLAARTRISNKISTLDISEGKVPIELLVIRGYRTPLQWAAQNGQIRVVQQLLEAGAKDSEAPATYSGRTALQAAAQGGHESVVRRLLEADTDADINAAPAPQDGRTALQAAASHGHEQILELLLRSNADVNAGPASDNGRTALQAAAEGGHERVVRFLLDIGAEVNAVPAEKNGRTALQAAAGGGHGGIVQLLLEAKANVNAEPAPHGGWTVLQAAAEGGHESIVESIVKMLPRDKADVNAKPAAYWRGRTALQAAAEGGHGSVVNLLLEFGAEVNADPALNFGRTALQAAAERGHEGMVKLLLEANSDVNAPPAPYDGRTALQAAAGGGNESIVRLLLEAGADVSAVPAFDSGRTALQAAAERGHESLVKLLLGINADINAKPAERNGRTALQAAADHGHENIVKLLLETKADINASPSEKNGLTALQAAARGGHGSVLELLLEAKADINAKPAPRGGRTALQAAAEGGHQRSVTLLLEANAKINAKPAGKKGRTALQAAAERGHESLVRLLLEAKADINMDPAPHDGRTALQAAAEGGHERIVKVLLDAHADVNAAPAPKWGQTALQAASEGGHERIVKLLLEANADVNAEPAPDLWKGQTALQAAACGGYESIVKMLLEAQADVNAAPAPLGGQTALQAASGGGHEQIVKLLLRANADVNAKPTAHRRTALQAAAEGSHENIVKLLLDAKADVNAEPADYGWTALQAAAERGHERIVKVLLEAGADVNAEPAKYDGRTALQAAANGGHGHIVKLLLDAGATVTTAVIAEAQHKNHLKIANLLLQAMNEDMPSEILPPVIMPEVVPRHRLGALWFISPSVSSLMFQS